MIPNRVIYTQPFAGGMHAAISWGFGILLVATCMVALQDYLGIPVLSGNFYLYFMSFTVDVFGIAATVGIVMALIRRYLARSKRLWQSRDREGYSLFLWLLLVILVTGYWTAEFSGLRPTSGGSPWRPPALPALSHLCSVR